MCKRPRDLLARFIILSPCAYKAKKACRFHCFSDDVNYSMLKKYFITLFKRVEFKTM